MADTILRDCKKCGQEFDSIYAVNNGICDECAEIKLTDKMEMNEKGEWH